MRIVRTAITALLVSTLTLPAMGETHDVFPDRFYATFSVVHEPVAKIQPGDTVNTTLLDSRGHDKTGKLVIYADNVLTGPFYVEGAEPGDTLVVHFNKVRLNRDGGWNGVRVGTSALLPGYVHGLYDNNYLEEWLQPGRRNALKWYIDLEKKITYPTRPLGDKVKMEFPAIPAVGCVGVAPPNKTVVTAGPTGPHGGNIDYNGIIEGTTVYLNVYEPGALFFLGDGHAAHGDGELLGNGTETSLDSTFTVDVIKNKRIGYTRLVEPDHIVTFGTLPGRTHMGFQAAITEMIQWLVKDYGVKEPEAHVLMGLAAELRVAAWNNTFMCRMAKKYLPQPKPEKMLSQAGD
jgi:acetamidase/formamidase